MVLTDTCFLYHLSSCPDFKNTTPGFKHTGIDRVRISVSVI